jgi:hypothetical protein
MLLGGAQHGVAPHGLTWGPAENDGRWPTEESELSRNIYKVPLSLIMSRCQTSSLGIRRGEAKDFDGRCGAHVKADEAGLCRHGAGPWFKRGGFEMKRRP